MSRSSGIAIGALSTRTGCNIETIRYYERVGLLPAPARSAGGYRIYEPSHVRRLRFVRRARGLGFTLDEIRTLLDLADGGSGACAEARALAESHLVDVRGKISDLRAMETALAETVRQCDVGRQSRCPVIEALSADD
ncbi:MAG: MerR family transcriptional regulator [Alphaproteobacteria bacterium]|nr:MerR family transcriptional regulator [Alphaproteobacteria bacterium]